MRSWSCILAVLAIVLGSPGAWSNEDGWELKKDKDGIRIYSRAVEGWEIHETRGVAHIPGRLSSAVAVIDDVPALHDLADVVAHAEVRTRESPTRYQFYSLIKMPWPVSDRDLLNQREIAQDGSTLAVTITDEATAGAPPPGKGVVRIVRSHQEWRLTPAADGGIDVQIQMLSDPAGPIPAAIINAMSVGTPFDTLTNLRSLVQKPKYANAGLAFIKDAKP